MWSPPPEPNYDYEVTKLIRYYRQSVTELTNALTSASLNELDAAMRKKLLRDTERILSELDDNAKEWIDENIPKAYREGQASTLVSTGEATTTAEAMKAVEFTRIHREFVDALIADTYDDLLQATQNTRRKVKSTIRDVVGEQLRAKATQNLGRKTMTRDIISDLKQRLGESAQFAIRDKANRTWRIEDYTDVVVRSKIQQAHVEGVRNQAIERDVYYGVISSHGATDPCRFHEGRIIKLVPNAPGDYPTYEELRATNQIFHPRCQHSVNSIRTPDLLPESVRLKAEQQNVVGNRAVATGQRNPKDVNMDVKNVTVPKPKPSAKPTAATYVKAEPLDVSKSKALKQMIEDPSLARKLGDGGEDSVLKTLLNEQGFDGKASIVSKSELDKYIDGKGEKELFRGVSESKFTDDFRDGEYFAGLGTYGNGTYTAYGTGEVLNGKRNADGLRVAVDYAGDSGSIMRMSLKSESKVANYDMLLGEMMDYEDELDVRVSKAKNKKEVAEIEAERLLIKDFGRFATIKGYDAIDIPSQKYLVVLNRTALRVQDKNFNLKGDKNGYNIK